MVTTHRNVEDLMRYHGKLEQFLAHNRCSVSISHCCRSQVWKGRCLQPRGNSGNPGLQTLPWSQCPTGLGAGSLATVDLTHGATGHVPGCSDGPHSWDRLLPSSVLGARQAQKPPDVSRVGLLSDGEEVGGSSGHR